MTDIHTFEMTERQAELLHQQISSHIAALKNWLMTAVEAGELERAQDLAAEIREHEALFALTNMQAKRDIAKAQGEPIKLKHGPKFPR